MDNENAIRGCLDMWSLDKPDAVDVYHSYRIHQIRIGEPAQSFDDFIVAYKEFTKDK